MLQHIVEKENNVGVVFEEENINTFNKNLAHQFHLQKN